MVEIFAWFIRFTSILSFIAGLFLVVGISIKTICIMTEWISESLIEMFALQKIFKEFSIYYKDKLKKGEIITPKLKKNNHD